MFLVHNLQRSCSKDIKINFHEHFSHANTQSIWTAVKKALHFSSIWSKILISHLHEITIPLSILFLRVTFVKELLLAGNDAKAKSIVSRTYFLKISCL